METQADWSILEDLEVLDICRSAAQRVAYRFEVDADDLEQEALIRVTTIPDLIECLDPSSGYTHGTLHYRLRRDLEDIARGVVVKRDRNTSYEQRTADSYEGDVTPTPASIIIRNDVSAYTRELIETLLPAVWDESYCYGVRAENAPDPDMPRGSTNKATGNTLAAHIADIKVGWTKAPLSTPERQALLLTYGHDWNQKEIGMSLNVSQQRVSQILYAGVGKVMACLNGDLAHMFELCDEREVAA